MIPYKLFFTASSKIFLLAFILLFQLSNFTHASPLSNLTSITNLSSTKTTAVTTNKKSKSANKKKGKKSKSANKKKGKKSKSTNKKKGKKFKSANKKKGKKSKSANKKKGKKSKSANKKKGKKSKSANKKKGKKSKVAKRINNSRNYQTNLAGQPPTKLIINPLRDLGKDKGYICFRIKAYSNTKISSFSKPACTYLKNSNNIKLTWDQVNNSIIGYQVFFGDSAKKTENFLMDVL